MRTNEGDICTNCGSYVLCLPHCESFDGEWGACGMFKKIVQWDGVCAHWWEGHYTRVELERLEAAGAVLPCGVDKQADV